MVVRKDRWNRPRFIVSALSVCRNASAWSALVQSSSVSVDFDRTWYSVFILPYLVLSQILQICRDLSILYQLKLLVLLYLAPVSYTHLDVYKRQTLLTVLFEEHTNFWLTVIATSNISPDSNTPSVYV